MIIRKLSIIAVNIALSIFYKQLDWSHLKSDAILSRAKKLK